MNSSTEVSSASTSIASLTLSGSAKTKAFRQGLHAQAEPAALRGRTGLAALQEVQNAAQLRAEVDGHDGGRGLVRAEAAVVARRGHRESYEQLFI